MEKVDGSLVVPTKESLVLNMQTLSQSLPLYALLARAIRQAYYGVEE
jgi:hypothetical protein